jgi:hypothetical protein
MRQSVLMASLTTGFLCGCLQTADTSPEPRQLQGRASEISTTSNSKCVDDDSTTVRIRACVNLNNANQFNATIAASGGPGTVSVVLLRCNPGCATIGRTGDFVDSQLINIGTPFSDGIHGSSYKARYSIDFFGNSAAHPDLNFDTAFILFP